MQKSLSPLIFKYEAASLSRPYWLINLAIGWIISVKNLAALDIIPVNKTARQLRSSLRLDLEGCYHLQSPVTGKYIEYLDQRTVLTILSKLHKLPEHKDMPKLAKSTIETELRARLGAMGLEEESAISSAIGMSISTIGIGFRNPGSPAFETIQKFVDGIAKRNPYAMHSLRQALVIQAQGRLLDALENKLAHCHSRPL